MIIQKSLYVIKPSGAVFLALISNHAGDTKYCAILQKHVNLLHKIKWNRRSYLLETRGSNHLQEVEDLRSCASHITTSVPDQDQ